MNQDDISLDNGRTEQDRFPAAPARGRNIDICFDCWDVSTQIALEAVEKVHQKRKPVSSDCKILDKIGSFNLELRKKDVNVLFNHPKEKGRMK